MKHGLSAHGLSDITSQLPSASLVPLGTRADNPHAADGIPMTQMAIGNAAGAAVTAVDTMRAAAVQAVVVTGSSKRTHGKRLMT